MQAHGSDRVRTVAGGRILLYSRYPKDWQARVAKTLTSPEHPGTAIFWDEAIYEVVSVEGAQQGDGVRYVLEPWREEHAIRVADHYDAEHEAHRESEHRARIARERNRKAVTLVAFLAGHLPAMVQEQMASELGMFSGRMTLLSVFSTLVVIGALIVAMAHQIMTGEGIHPWQVILTAFLGVENVIRFHVAWSQNRPIGSTFGVLVYSIAFAFGWKRAMISPLQETKGNALYIREEAKDTKLRDAFHLREPLVTLLTPAEQARFAERFDYDYRRHSSTVAAIFLIFALAGVVTSFRTLGTHPGPGALISLVCAGWITVEQLLRLMSFRRGPSGSILGILARPFVMNLLAGHG